MNRTSTNITAEVPDGDVANDLAVRVYVQNSSAGKTGRIDLARVRFTRYSRTWTLHRTRMVDASDGTAATDNWGLVTAGDGAYLQTAGNWSNTFSGTRYVDFVVAGQRAGGRHGDVGDAEARVQVGARRATRRAGSARPSAAGRSSRPTARSARRSAATPRPRS